MPRKMVRTSGPVRTAALPPALTLWISCVGTGSITSTSPESRAATRVAADAIGVKTISLRLCSGLPHQFGFGLNTVFTPGWWLSMMKGPVPFSCSEAWLGVVADAGVGATELFSSHHFLSMLNQPSHCEIRMGLGESSFTSTV